MLYRLQKESLVVCIANRREIENRQRNNIAADTEEEEDLTN